MTDLISGNEPLLSGIAALLVIGYFLRERLRDAWQSSARRRVTVALRSVFDRLPFRIVTTDVARRADLLDPLRGGWSGVSKEAGQPFGYQNDKPIDHCGLCGKDVPRGDPHSCLVYRTYTPQQLAETSARKKAGG